MILIKLSDENSKRKALGYLTGRFSFKSWANGDLLVPEEALSELAHQGVRFAVEGPASYDQFLPASVRDSLASSVQ